MNTKRNSNMFRPLKFHLLNWYIRIDIHLLRVWHQ